METTLEGLGLGSRAYRFSAAGRNIPGLQVSRN